MLKLFEGKKQNVLGFAWFAATLLLIELTGNHSLASSADVFLEPLNITRAFLNISLVAAVFYACIGAGRRIFEKLDLCGPDILALSAGIIALNIGILPLFFLNLLNTPILICLFCVLFAVGKFGKISLFPAQKNFKYALLLTFAAFMVPQLVNAVVPVLLWESLSDAANGYYPLQLLFAGHGGAFFNPAQVAALSKLCQYDAFVSVFMVLANPPAAKIVGLFLFLGLGLNLYSFVEKEAGGWAGVLAVFLLLSAKDFQDIGLFSFVHERVLLTYLTFSLFHIVWRGIDENKAAWHLLAFSGLGVLAGTAMAAEVSVCLCLLLIASKVSLWRANLRRYAAGFLLMCCIALCFPLWNYLNTGAVLPTASALTKTSSVPTELISPINLELWGMYFQHARVSLQDYLIYPLSFLLRQFGLLGLLAIAGLFFVRRGCLRYLYCYAFVALLAQLFLLKIIFTGGAMDRFLFHLLPLFMALIAVISGFLLKPAEALHTDRRRLFAISLAVLLALIVAANAAYIFKSGENIGDKMLMTLKLTPPNKSLIVRPFYVDDAGHRRIGFVSCSIGHKYTASFYERVRSLDNNATGLNRVFAPPFSGNPDMLVEKTHYNSYAGAVGLCVPADALPKISRINLIVGNAFYEFSGPEWIKSWPQTGSSLIGGKPWVDLQFTLPTQGMFAALSVRLGRAVKESLKEASLRCLGRRKYWDGYFLKLDYLFGRITPTALMMSYEEGVSVHLARSAEQLKIINKLLAPADVVAAFGRVPRAYMTVPIYSPVMHGGTSAIWGSRDMAAVMGVFAKYGITYLFFDTYDFDDASVYFFLSPMFAPETFAKYFVRVKNVEGGYFLFKIVNDGLDGKNWADNFRDIADSGFYSAISAVLLKNAPDMHSLRHNPTTPKEMADIYRAFCKSEKIGLKR